MQPHVSSIKTGWPIPLALLALSLIPVIAGAARLYGLVSGAQITSQNARFFASPLPVVLHIIGASLFCVFGAFQFWQGFRTRNPHLHRVAGYIAGLSGLVAAFSALWMNQFYPYAENDGPLLYGFRLLFGVGMLVALVLGLLNIMQGKFAEHGAWMARGYAIGLGAGTQALIQLLWIFTAGVPEELPRAVLMGGGWVVNLLVAEWAIEKGRSVQRKCLFFKVTV